MIPLWMLGAAAAAVGGAWWVRQRGANSAREDMAEDLTVTCDPVLATALGWPYWFGKGTPATPWESGADGVDCSGFAQMALVKLNLLSSSAPDRGARTLADDSDPIELGQQRIGDLAYYPGHVMVVAGSPGYDGHSPVIGASGGTGTTLGNDEKARVKLFSSGLYNSEFVCYMRPRPL
jgi:cell wall-associated NlpC family hydrolase